MRRVAWIVVAVALAWVMSGAAAEPAASELLERGVYTEETVGDLKAAIELYRQVVSNAETDRPYVAQAYYRLGRALVRAGQPEEGYATLTKVIRLFPEQTELVKQAEAALASRSSDTVAGVRLTGDAKVDAEALMARGWALWQQQQFAEAEEAFAKAVELDASQENAWNGLGWSRANQGKPEAAKEAFHKVLDLNPKHAAALNGLGWIAKVQGNVEGALEWWRKAVEASPDATAAWRGFATTYMERGDFAKAAEAYRKVLEFEPDNEEAQKGLDAAESGQASPPKAGAPSGQPSADAPKDEEGWSDLVKAALEQGDLIAALDAEMGRVLLRQKEGNAYADKVDLVSVWERFREKHSGTPGSLGDQLPLVDEYLKRHAGDKEYVWRAYHLLSRMTLDTGKSIQPHEDARESAENFLNEALDAYPLIDYEDPARLSKYQHLANERAGLMWDSQGVDTAEQLLLEMIQRDPKLEYVFAPWWQERYEKAGQPERFAAFQRKIVAALQARLKNLPDRASRTQRYLDELTAALAREDHAERGDLVAMCEAQMRWLATQEGSPWKDKNELVPEYKKYVDQSNPSPEQKAEALTRVEDLLAQHKGEADYEWRLCQLLGAMHQDLGQKDEAARCLDEAIRAYPDMPYGNPAKQSKFQHLVNNRAMLILEAQGPEAAEEYALNLLRTDPRFHYFHDNPWMQEYRQRYGPEKGMQRLEELKAKVREAYEARERDFPGTWMPAEELR